MSTTDTAAPPQVQVMPSATWPKVNLLPPEVAQNERAGRIRLVMAGAVLVSAAIIWALSSSASNEAADAAAQADSVAAQVTTVNGELAKLSSVPNAATGAATAQAALASAMGTEIRWSFVLSDLSSWIPGTVGLDSVAMNSTPNTTPYGRATVGQVVLTGKALNHNSVAALLDVLRKTPSMIDPFISSSVLSNTNQLTGAASAVQPSTGPVQFQGNIGLNSSALSQRYVPSNQKVG